MAAPETCEITSPLDGATFGALPDGTYTTDVVGTTDPDVDVELFFGAVSQDTGTADENGDFVFEDVEFPTGTTVVTVVAGTDPDTLESDPVDVIVTDLLATITNADQHTTEWYLNWLAGSNMASPSLLTAHDAACLWASVSARDYSLIGALNTVAGNARSLWIKNMNVILNQVSQEARGLTFPNYTVPWQSNQEALLTTCQENQA